MTDKAAGERTAGAATRDRPVEEDLRWWAEMMGPPSTGWRDGTQKLLIRAADEIDRLRAALPQPEGKEGKHGSVSETTMAVTQGVSSVASNVCTQSGERLAQDVAAMAAAEGFTSRDVDHVAAKGKEHTAWVCAGCKRIGNSDPLKCPVAQREAANPPAAQQANPLRGSFLHSHMVESLLREPDWTPQMYAAFNDVAADTTKLLVALWNEPNHGLAALASPETKPRCSCPCHYDATSGLCEQCCNG